MLDNHPTTNSVSRRHFVKTSAAVAAAAASTRIAGAPISAAGEASALVHPIPHLPQWKITETEVQTLWTELWPKIVALSWRLPAYRSAFEDSQPAKRREEVLRIASALPGISYASDIPIHLDGIDTNGASVLGIPMTEYAGLFENQRQGECPPLPPSPAAKLYGDTFFIINEHGIILPWPTAPNLPEIWIGYFQGGGVLPRASGPSSAEAALLSLLKKVPTASATSHPTIGADGISGVALFRLFEKWPNTVALVWDDPSTTPTDPGDRAKDIISFPRKYVLPEVWSRWPLGVRETVIVDSDDFVLSHDFGTAAVDLLIPIPVEPATTALVFDELIVGHATNPMYSNCY